MGFTTNTQTTVKLTREGNITENKTIEIKIDGIVIESYTIPAGRTLKGILNFNGILE